MSRKPSRLKRRPIKIIAERVIEQTQYYEKRYLDNPYLDIFVHLRGLGNTSNILDTIRYQPNVVVIVRDDQEADRLKIEYGNDKRKPPYFYGVSSLINEMLFRIRSMKLPVIVDPSAMLYYPSFNAKTVKQNVRIDNSRILKYGEF